jgi:hypothetical protein
MKSDRKQGLFAFFANPLRPLRLELFGREDRNKSRKDRKRFAKFLRDS